MTLPYEEGTWFAVPLRSGGYGVGIVARSAKQGKVLLGYFFGPQRDVVPPSDEVSSLRATEAILVVRFGDLSLINKKWPIIGRSSTWVRQDWPMPSFVRKDELSGRVWKVDYADDNPNKVAAEKLLASNGDGLERDAVFGAGAVELVLTKMLGS